MLKQKRLSSRFLVLASAFFILTGPIFVIAPTQKAYAASVSWDDGGDGRSWYDCNNWSGNVCPTGSDEITIGSGFVVALEDVSFKLNSGGSLAIHSGATLEIFYHERTGLDNSGTIVNDGSFRFGTELRNAGKIQNNAGATIESSGGDPWYNTGIIINEGTFFNGGGVLNDGTITNKCPGVFIDGAWVDGNPVVNEPCSPSTCDNPTITGTDDNDVIDGTPGADVINGKDGEDKINGLGGNDIICGGSGNDSLSGGAGYDVIFGGHGNDVITGGLGNDQLNGGAGTDSLDGNGGDDKLLGSSGNDTLNGKDGVINNDSINGGFGTDTCDGNPDPEVNCEL